ncbi:MAG: imidazolonepropionase [Actinomycetota bacterium]|nr:imidazolonepropionase [Actinomycetota bacterium]
MTTLVTGIAELTTCDPTHPDAEDEWGTLHDAALVLGDGEQVLWVGHRGTRPPDADRFLDLGGRAVVPAFVDSHTHLVFAGDRSAEFAARMSGTPYDGGGIATTVAATRGASDDALRALLHARVAEMRSQGTGVIEVKSGYGLDLPTETRLLRLGREVTDEVTFLGAHVVPPEYRSRRNGPRRPGDRSDDGGRRGIRAVVDVFCEPHSPHAFGADEARTILEAGRAAGLGLRVHGNQLGPGPGVDLAVELGAASVDHCTHLTAADADALAGSGTVATLLPGVEFATRSRYPDARALLDAGVTIALATDCNPGTCYTSSMPFVIALAVHELHLTPGEALWAATRGAARSLHRDDIGQIAVGARGGLTVLDAPSQLHLSYRAGVPLSHRLTVGL